MTDETKGAYPAVGCWTRKLYERVQRKPLDLYWGRNGWCPSSLPRGVKRVDFDELMNSGLVMVKLAQMIPISLRLEKCKCDFRTRLVGDGCQWCNPEYAADQKGDK